jgi:hypothetical protein
MFTQSLRRLFGHDFRLLPYRPPSRSELRAKAAFQASGHLDRFGSRRAALAYVDDIKAKYPGYMRS